MVGGDESLKDPIFRAMIRAGELAGEVYLATDNSSGKVVAVAVWFPPGISLFNSSDFFFVYSTSTHSFAEKNRGLWVLTIS